jgi:outer membrane protein assembly factor BamE (lipoprotein component of BamABCDE complex)
MKKLNPGMSKQKVVKILGQPDSFRSAGEYEALKYSDKLMRGTSWDRADYYVIFKNDKLIEYGTGKIREKDSNVLVLIPLN